MNHFNLTTNITTMPVSFTGNNTIIVNGTEYIPSSVYRTLVDNHWHDILTCVYVLLVVWCGMLTSLFLFPNKDRIIEKLRQEAESRQLELQVKNGGSKKALGYGAVDLEKADCTVPLLRGPIKGVTQK
jgi:hypothetical protein